ncbi:MAG: methionyl-tRNA formyltransferase [Candidatus Adlerbacteria bacterium]
MKKPLFVFFGTPKFSVHVLDALEKHGLLPALVVTAPDRHQGRGLVLTPSPANVWATERGIDVLTPATLSAKGGSASGGKSFAEELQNTDWDVFLVAAYAKLIPKNILDIPRRGCLNVHPSLLPKFRGPSPAVSAILADERATGVTIMQMAEKMDAGPVVAQAQVELEIEAWPPKGSEFEELLATEGGNLLAETLPFYIAGDITPEVQDEAAATFTKKFVDTDSLIDLAGDSHEQLLKIRAFDKNPRAHFITAAGKRVIITEADIVDGKLNILRVIPEGKKEMPFEQFQQH